MLDVVTIGEAMIRLAAPPGEGLESASHFDARVAGAEANVAVTLARMGFRAGWISKLADDPLGSKDRGRAAAPRRGYVHCGLDLAGTHRPLLRRACAAAQRGHRLLRSRCLGLQHRDP